MQNKTIYRNDYTPYPFSILSLDLSIDLFEDHALVTNTMRLKRERPGELLLSGENLELISIHMNETSLSENQASLIVSPLPSLRAERSNPEGSDQTPWIASLRSQRRTADETMTEVENQYVLSKEALLIKSCPTEFSLTLVTRIYPQKNTALCGLYRSNHLFCTQCEAEGFRQITYFPDRPDVLTIYTTRISAVKADYPILLSNGNLIDKGETADGRHWVIWNDPFKKPSYLFALVAGNLGCISDKFVTQSGRTIDLHIYVEPGNEGKCAHAMTSLKNAMRWDEEHYGREYDLDIFMIVAVSDFNMGAMENKGLNIFNAKYILACPKSATDQDYADIEGVVAHEYFHNWTGNRVTCQDWFQLSLKEGLTVFRDQEFSSDMNSRDVNRISDVKLLQNHQFPEDAGAMAHPVRPESYQEINNFYTATVYNKGAEVIRMQHTLLGEAGFRQGMDLYFERHDGEAVTIDAFVKAMEDANHVDFTQFKRWYSQAGTPEVTVSSIYDDNNHCLTLKFSQSCPATPECQDKKPFHIPIRAALLSSDGEIMQQLMLELKDAEGEFQIKGLEQNPVISLLRDFSAPIKLHQTQTEDELLTLLQYETNGYAKWNAAKTLVLNTLSTWLNAPIDEWTIAPKLIQAFKHVLNNQSLDTALRADILMPPDHEEVASSQQNVDVALIETIRDAYRKALGLALFDDAELTYQALCQQENNAMQGEAYGRRKLKNTCLYLMMKANEEAAIPHCQQQFSTAVTMTDKIAGFALLVNSSNDSIRQQAIDAFYREWSGNDLVIEKWFAIQASSEAPHALTRIKALLTHPAFQLTNPNKVRSVIGTFTQANPRHFHALDGSGYIFLTEMLLKLDRINAHIAARLATPFTRGQRLDAPRQALIQEQLDVLNTNELSRDLREVVSKSMLKDGKKNG